MSIQATTSQSPAFLSEGIQIDYKQISFPRKKYNTAQLDMLLKHPEVKQRFERAMIASDGFTMFKKKHAAKLLGIKKARVPTIIFYKRKTDTEPKIYALFNEALKKSGDKIVKKMTPLEKGGQSYVEMVPKDVTDYDFEKEWEISNQLIEQKIDSTVHLNLVSWDKKDRLIAEHYPFGSLREYVDQLEISSIYPGCECLDVIVQLATILESLHARGFCHLDLKMPNIFLKPDGDQYKVILGDLGTVANISSENVDMLATYPPPEVKVHETITPYPEIDLWGLGLILSYLKNRDFGYRPFAFDQIQKSVGKEALELHRTALEKEQHPWNQLILKLLSDNKDERLSATEVKNFFIDEMKKNSTSTIDTNKDTHLEKHPIE